MPTLTADRERQLADVVRDPVRFARGLLQHDTWGTQAAILRSVATHPRTAVKACHASGKTYMAAEAVLWWVTRFPDGIVVTTAPTWVQVEKLLWGEIHRSIATARIDYPTATTTQLKLGPNRYAMGLSTNEGVRFQGFHGRILIVIDEATGVAPDIYEAIEGIRAGGDVRVLALGNPTVASGPFYDAFTAHRANWQTFTIDAFDTPNLAGLPGADADEREAYLAGLDGDSPELLESVRPYLVTRRWAWEKYHEWGKESPLYQARVRGRFPDQSEDALISLRWLEAARYRELVDDGGPVEAGVDVAGPGEAETVLYVRRGPHLLAMQAWTNPDPRGDLLAALLPYRGRLTVCNVDTVGIGYYLSRHLQDAGIPVRDINVGVPPVDRERYYNLKAELYWGLRQWFETGGITGLTDDTTISQLASIRYKPNRKGQITIERKEDALKRGVKSPDRAEALMLAFATAEGGIFAGAFGGEGARGFDDAEQWW